jgi:protein tyrosine phosphatase
VINETNAKLRYSRYANVIPLPETRVHLSRQDDDEKTEYINANFVKVMCYFWVT